MPERTRPDPEALLAQAQEGEKGRLKVFLGMAAGVGKTYSMLQAAQDSKSRGVDVVIGYLEPHDRKDTENMAEGLEMIPHRAVPGIAITEFDVDAALARRPRKVLVDELAHTNAKGSRHAKRWQDVQDLIQAGIDVDTTINIQHLESLNDVVAQITGIRVSETVPDSIINEADEVELVDIPPDELISRLHEGKVYVPDKIEQALQSFFKKRNLLALRELALRHTAERVEQQVRTARAAEGAVQPWHTNQRILVCVAPNRMASRVVRAAKRMADALHAELIAVYVESIRQSSVSDQDKALAAEALRLAESLGATAVTLNSQDIAQELVRYSQEKNVTTIVIGKPIRSKWRELLFGSVVDSLVRSSGDIDVHVITGAQDVGTPLRLVDPQSAVDTQGYVAAVVVTALASLLCEAMVRFFSPTNLVMVYLLGVAFVATRHSLRAAMLASVLCVLAFDFLFVPPRFTFAVTDVEYVFTFGVMLLVALLLSTLTARLRDQSLAASERERRTSALFDLSKRLSSTRNRSEISSFAAEKIREVFNCDVAVLVRDRKTGKLFGGTESRTGFEVGDREQGVAEWVKDHGLKAGNKTETLPAAQGVYYPLNGEKACVGVLALKWDRNPPTSPSQIHFLEAFAVQLAAAIERTNMAKDSHEATIQAERERLRNTLLSSVSHDLRTPLSVISATAEELKTRLASAESSNADLADSIAKEAARLERQVRDLLDMTRLESGSVQLRRNWQSVEELIGSAVLRTEALLGKHDVQIDIPNSLALIWVDQVLMEQTLVNILENAARYTPPGTHVLISASAESASTSIQIANDGPSLPPTELEAIFEKFGRGQDSGSRGAGLGLAICRAIVEAHSGAIVALPLEPCGVRFVITLPNDLQPPEVPIA